ncbi:signal peptidase I [Sphingobium sp. SCG-1]|uniref:signal peptidase I n=1 Tax=Sphingobium sp. SCG-1 TaxID=2072936 RepID=UPI000CD69051|nr:signal peptidase I [Sphingobium sp. SCG-1]AUW56706.1 signal peptidase I [Sphingobium sp. SCG-1]AUW59955.1 signal peptidase I [Sphingobium sp. SCG-1]
MTATPIDAGQDTSVRLDFDSTADHSGHETGPEGGAPSRHGVDWWQEIKSIVVLVLAVLFFHSFVAKPFYIPSESMMPVLLTGDRLVVSKYPYGWSFVSPSFHPLPFIKGRIFGRLPERGDIVIVTPQARNEDYIKRVIGLPGDILEVRDGIVILNGIPVPQKWIPPLRIPVDANAPCPPDQFPGALVEDRSGKRWCELPVKQETLPNGKTYKIIDVGARTLDWYGPVRIPDHHVFLMGDNRDNSADSRATLADRGLGGPVPWEAIGGRAEFITFSLDGTASINPFSWFGALRSGRAGSSLRPATESGQ